MAFISRIVVSSLSIYFQLLFPTGHEKGGKWGQETAFNLFLDKFVKPLSSAVSCMTMLICFHFWMNYYNKAKTVVNVLLDIKSLSH